MLLFIFYSFLLLVSGLIVDFSPSFVNPTEHFYEN